MRRIITIGLCAIAVAGQVFAASFTAVTNGVDWQDKDVWNEILVAFNEVVESAEWSTAWTYDPEEASTNSLFVGGEDLQERLSTNTPPAYDGWMYRKIQRSIEQMTAAGVFIDPSIPATNYTTPQAYSTTSLWVAAGMTTNGWRRATEYIPGTNDWTSQTNAMYSYGQMEAGDIIGNWIWADLQSCLLLMHTTYADQSSTARFRGARYEHYANSGGTKDGFDELYEDMTNAWAAGSYTSDDFTDGDSPLPAQYGHAVMRMDTNRWRREKMVYRRTAYALTAEDGQLTASTNCQVKFYAVARQYIYTGIGTTTNHYADPLGVWDEGDTIEFDAAYVANTNNYFTQHWESAWMPSVATTSALPPCDLLNAWNDANSYPPYYSTLQEGVTIGGNDQSWWQVKFDRTYTD